MKKHIPTFIISAIVCLMVNLTPVLAGIALYGVLGYLCVINMFIPIMKLEVPVSRFDKSYYGICVMFGVVWPVASIVSLIVEFDLYKKHFNFPEFRNPFYWPSDDENTPKDYKNRLDKYHTPDTL